MYRLYLILRNKGMEFVWNNQIFSHLFGNLAHFRLGTWRISVWELGAFLFGNLAHFRLGTWRISVWELGAFPFGNLARFRLGTWRAVTIPAFAWVGGSKAFSYALRSGRKEKRSLQGYRSDGASRCPNCIAANSFVFFKGRPVFRVCHLPVGSLSVDDFAVFVLVGLEVLGILVHGAQAHTHAGEAAIVEEVLHGNLAGEV